MSRTIYPADLTDVEWVLVAPYVTTSGYGRPPLHAKRELLNAIFYQAQAGCSWPSLPSDMPPWRTVYKQFEAWRESGTWAQLMDGLGRAVRQPTRAAEPTGVSVRTDAKAKRGPVAATTRARQQLAGC